MEKRCISCMEEYEEGISTCPHCGYREGSYEEDQYHLPIRTVLKGRYIIGKPLGHGGFGVTYVAWDSLLEKKVAIKEYLPSDFATRAVRNATVRVYNRDSAEKFKKGMESFLNESRRLARFNTIPGIVSIFDCFTENSTAYIVMEYLDGRTLGDLVKEKGKLPYDEAVYIMIQVLNALDVVHQEGIVHRDIAPDNVFICKDGRIKLIDFGAARFVTTTHSRSLSMILKLGYAPVEQYSTRGHQGTWTDVYACGATLYYAITGVVPPHSYDRIDETKDDKMIKPSRIVKKLPKNVETAILNAMNILPENRTQTAKAFAEELESLIDVQRVKEKIQHEDTGKIPQWLKMNAAASVAIVAAVVLLIIVGVTTIVIRNDRMVIPNGMTRIPNVINDEFEDAEKKLEDAELKMVIGERLFDDYYQNFAVVIQNPYAGGVAFQNSLVTVTLSGNSDMVIIPNLTFATRDLAKSTLESLGLLVEFEEQFSSKVAKDCVIKQSKKPDSSARPGETILLTISKGSEDDQYDYDHTVGVPDLVGMDIKEADKLLRKKKLLIVVGGTQYNNQYAKDTIIDQSVLPETQVSEGTVITVTVSLGKKMSVVPDVMYMSEDNAIAKITSNSLRYSVSYAESQSVSAGCVMSQKPKPGSSVNQGSTVKIVISKGYTIPVPDVTGKKAQDAKEILQSAGLACNIVSEPSDTVAQGNVIRQSVKSGERVEQGTIIEIVVSSGPKTINVTGVRLNKTSATLDFGEKLTLFATISPKNATNTVVSWSSSNAGVASVDGNGVVTAKAVGVAAITVTTADGNYKATCSVEVIKTVKGITASGYRTAYYLDESFSKNMTVTATYSDSSTSNVASACTFSGFSSDNPGTCTVNVAYSYRSKEVNTSFNVTIVKPTELVLDTSSCKTSYLVGESFSSAGLKVTAKYSNGTSRSIGVDKCSFSGFSSKNGGNRTVTVKYTEGNVAKITVQSSYSYKVSDGISLNSKELNLAVDGQTYPTSGKLTVKFASGSSEGRTVTWSSSNTGIATVDGSGNVTAKGVGKCVVKAKTDQGLEDSCNVTVYKTTDWTDSFTLSGMTAQAVNSKTQYRGRKYEYKESEATSLDGWERYGSENRRRDNYGEWVRYGTSEPSNEWYREKKTVRECTNTSGYNLKYYHYFRHHYPNASKSYFCTHVSGGSGATEVETLNLPEGSQLTNRYNAGHTYRCSYGCHGESTGYTDSAGHLWFLEYTWDEWVDTSTYENIWYYRDKPEYTVYFYRRLGSYCDWTDTVLNSSNGYYEVQTRTLYRYLYTTK